MSQTQQLLGKIAALRQRLEQAQDLLSDAGSLLPQETRGGDGVALLERKVQLGEQQAALMEQVLPKETAAKLPGQLTARAVRLLKRGRELLDQLRAHAEEPLFQAEGEPLAALYRE